MASNVVDLSDCKEDINGLTNTLQTLKLRDENIGLLPSWMKDCETAILWYSQHKKSHPHSKLLPYGLDKINGWDKNDPELFLFRYSMLLRILVEYLLLENDEKLHEAISAIKYFFDRDSAVKHAEFENYKNILSNILAATLAHVFAIQGNAESSKMVVANLTPISKMSKNDLAKLWSIKVSYIMHSYDNSSGEAVQLARQILSLEPKNHAWRFLLARTLRQARRSVPFSKEIPKEEFELLTVALSKNRSATYLAFTAQVYREFAAQTYHNHKKELGYYRSKLHKSTVKMHQQALDYYKESLEDRDNSASNLRRIGYGIMNLPRNIADYDLAEKCLLESVELWDDPNTQQVLGTFYQVYRKDYNAALECYEKAAHTESYIAVNDLIKLKYLMNNNYDPSEDLEKAIKGAISQNDRTRFILNLGSYYLFIKRDLLQSLKYFNEIINEGKESLYMLNYKSPFYHMNDPINLYHYLANEAHLYLKNSNSYPDSDNEVKSEVMALVESINSICPQLAYLDLNPDLIQILRDKSDEILAKRNSRPTHQVVVNTLRDGRSDFFYNTYQSHANSGKKYIMKFVGKRGKKCYTIIQMRK